MITESPSTTLARPSKFWAYVAVIAGGLLLLSGIAAALAFTGGLAFSPGEVSAEARNHTPLNGQASHVTFETACGQCHAPFTGVSAERWGNLRSWA